MDNLMSNNNIVWDLSRREEGRLKGEMIFPKDILNLLAINLAMTL